MQTWEEARTISSPECTPAGSNTALNMSEVQSIKGGGGWNAVRDGGKKPQNLVIKTPDFQLGKVSMSVFYGLCAILRQLRSLLKNRNNNNKPC